MSGDYTRFTFAARKLFSGVLKQQGRVSLDADFNEFQEILDRRDRSEMYDTVGPAVVPQTTPDGFAIAVNGAGTLTIGVGRNYVDGIQAECFGDMQRPAPPAVPAPTELDAAMGNLRGVNPLLFDAQPFHYTTPPFPAISATAGVINMLYLDVWQREVTSWEDERLLDQALGGVDTATRIQTAWQVKALQNVAADACTNPPQAWTDLIAPSTARLTAAASSVPLPPGPCVIQPAGGYSGRENRLYRVEVHKAGTLAGPNVATMKWSRDNAALTASVMGISTPGATSVIQVDSTGRDSWERFEVPQQIELLDDEVEFAMRDSASSGRLARITNVNHATGEISVDQNFSTFGVIGGRHPRIRRWDTDKDTDPAEVPVKNGIAIPLEAGISISFGDGTPAHATDTLHAGDYWVFSARTADGSIDVVADEPPRGILHHFAPLAIVTSGAPPTVDDDCRNPWPVPCDCEGGGCECDQCVTQESHDSGVLTVQDAVLKVIAAGGGTVCIGIGYFKLSDGWIGITNAASVQVRGRGLLTILEYIGSGPAIRIGTAVDITVRDLSLITERSGDEPANAIEVDGAALVTLERLNVIEDPLGLLSFLDQGGSGKRIGAAIGLAGFVLRTVIRDCNLAGGAGVAARSWVSRDDEDYLVAVDLEIAHDLVLAANFGVVLGVPGGRQPDTVLLADGTLIRDNTIWGCAQAGIALAGQVIADSVEVERNIVGTLSYGAALATDRTTLADNTLMCISREERSGRGIAVFRGQRDLVRDVWVRGNRIDNFPGAGVYVDATVANLLVEANTIQWCGYGILMSDESRGEGVRVVANHLADIGTPGGDGNPIILGIGLVFTVDGEVIDNTVNRLATFDENAIWRAGIQLIACRAVRISGNTVTDVGPLDYQASVLALPPPWDFERLDVTDNAVRPGPDGAKGAWYALLIGASNDQWSGSLIELGKIVWWVDPNSAFQLISLDTPTEAAVRGNHLIAVGETPTARVQTPGSCTFSENWCTAMLETGLPVVSLGDSSIEGGGFRLRALALANNQVRHPGTDSLAVDAWVVEDTVEPQQQAASATVLGNVTEGRIHLNGQPLPPPWFDLNVVIP